MSGVEEEDEAVESMLFVHRSVNIYKIPPRVGLASYRFASRSFAPYVPSDFDRQNGLSPNPLENPLHSLPRFETAFLREGVFSICRAAEWKEVIATCRIKVRLSFYTSSCCHLHKPAQQEAREDEVEWEQGKEGNQAGDRMRGSGGSGATKPCLSLCPSACLVLPDTKMTKATAP
eukprot:43989-Rhodomonas_salina.1